MFSYIKTTLIAALVAAPTLALALTGEGTFYYTGLGACGKVNTDTDMIAALSYKLFDTLYPGHTGNPNFNPICGKRLRATYGGKSVTVTVVDRCADCYGMFNVDFSPVAFTQLAAESVGRIRGLQWEFIDAVPAIPAPPAARRRGEGKSRIEY